MVAGKKRNIRVEKLDLGLTIYPDRLQKLADAVGVESIEQRQSVFIPFLLNKSIFSL